MGISVTRSSSLPQRQWRKKGRSSNSLTPPNFCLRLLNIRRLGLLLIQKLHMPHKKHGVLRPVSFMEHMALLLDVDLFFVVYFNRSQPNYTKNNLSNDELLILPQSLIQKASSHASQNTEFWDQYRSWNIWPYYLTLFFFLLSTLISHNLIIQKIILVMMNYTSPVMPADLCLNHSLMRSFFSPLNACFNPIELLETYHRYRSSPYGSFGKQWTVAISRWPSSTQRHWNVVIRWQSPGANVYPNPLLRHIPLC